jgi:hypothetical protein
MSFQCLPHLHTNPAAVVLARHRPSSASHASARARPRAKYAAYRWRRKCSAKDLYHLSALEVGPVNRAMPDTVHPMLTPRYPGPRNTTTQPARPTEAERTPRPTRAASGSSGVTPPSAAEIGALER